ncbi:hypothetical protein LguiA_002687 [Lonicera macranthoides]
MESISPHDSTYVPIKYFSQKSIVIAIVLHLVLIKKLENEVIDLARCSPSFPLFTIAQRTRFHGKTT